MPFLPYCFRVFFPSLLPSFPPSLLNLLPSFPPSLLPSFPPSLLNLLPSFPPSLLPSFPPSLLNLLPSLLRLIPPYSLPMNKLLDALATTRRLAKLKPQKPSAQNPQKPSQAPSWVSPRVLQAARLMSEAPPSSLNKLPVFGGNICDGCWGSALGILGIFTGRCIEGCLGWRASGCPLHGSILGLRGWERIGCGAASRGGIGATCGRSSRLRFGEISKLRV